MPAVPRPRGRRVKLTEEGGGGGASDEKHLRQAHKEDYADQGLPNCNPPPASPRANALCTMYSSVPYLPRER